jgi:hypothetical protein
LRPRKKQEEGPGKPKKRPQNQEEELMYNFVNTFLMSFMLVLVKMKAHRSLIEANSWRIAEK